MAIADEHRCVLTPRRFRFLGLGNSIARRRTVSPMSEEETAVDRISCANMSFKQVGSAVSVGSGVSQPRWLLFGMRDWCTHSLRCGGPIRSQAIFGTIQRIETHPYRALQYPEALQAADCGSIQSRLHRCNMQSRHSPRSIGVCRIDRICQIIHH